MLTIDSWLKAAFTDADQGGVPVLEPVLEPSVLSTKALCKADWNGQATRRPGQADRRLKIRRSGRLRMSGGGTGLMFRGYLSIGPMEWAILPNVAIKRGTNPGGELFQIRLHRRVKLTAFSTSPHEAHTTQAGIRFLQTLH